MVVRRGRDLLVAHAREVRQTNALEPEESVAAAFAEHWPQIVAYATGIVGDGVEAEDLAQEAFVRLLQLARSGVWPERHVAWLRTVVTNLAVSRYRHAAVVAKTATILGSVGEERSDSGDPVLVAAQHEERAAIRRALDALSPDRRAVAMLAAAGFSAAEIAPRLDRSPGAIRTLICRTRRSLRTVLRADPAMT